MIAHLRQGARRIVVTGASGWIGLVTLEYLLDELGEDDFRRSVACFGSTGRTLELRGGRKVEQRPLDEIVTLAAKPTWLFHFAFLTKDRALDMDEAAYRAANDAISQRVLATLDTIGVDGLFLASSGAAYRAEDATATPDMRLYGAMKRDDEERFATWAKRSRRALVIARIFNVTGPYINKHQAYAFASFLLDALAGRTIEVRAPHAVVRAYVPIREVISLGFALLASLRSGGVLRFDTGGEPMELTEVAQAIAAAVSGGDVRRAVIGNAPADIYHGDVESYAKLLAANDISSTPLSEQILDTMTYLKTLAGCAA
jgi:UDP-glucuronate decarboxylase